MKNTFISKKRGKRGEGRATIFKAINLPVELVEDLQLYKTIYEICFASGSDEYGNPIPAKISYEQMLRHWMDNVDKFDPLIAKDYLNAKKGCDAQPLYYCDPTLGDVWELEYMFSNIDGDEYPASIGEIEPFETTINGEVVGMEEMINREFSLYNEAGIELSYRQALIVKKRILEHREGQK